MLRQLLLRRYRRLAALPGSSRCQKERGIRSTGLEPKLKKSNHPVGWKQTESKTDSSIFGWKVLSTGLEPMTLALSEPRATNCAKRAIYLLLRDRANNVALGCFYWVIFSVFSREGGPALEVFEVGLGSTSACAGAPVCTAHVRICACACACICLRAVLRSCVTMRNLGRPVDFIGWIFSANQLSHRRWRHSSMARGLLRVVVGAVLLTSQASAFTHVRDPFITSQCTSAFLLLKNVAHAQIPLAARPTALRTLVLKAEAPLPDSAGRVVRAEQLCDGFDMAPPKTNCRCLDLSVFPISPDRQRCRV